MRTRLLVCFSLVAVFGAIALAALQGTQGTIVGQVTDPSGLPLEGVNVNAGGVSTVTDAGGLYTLENVEQAERVVVTFTRDDLVTTYGVANLFAAPADDGNTDSDSDSGSGSGSSGSSGHHTHRAGRMGRGRAPIGDRRATVRSREIVSFSSQQQAGQYESFAQDHGSEDSESSASSSDSSGSGGGMMMQPTSATVTKVMLPKGTPQTVDAGNGGTAEQDGFFVRFPAGAIDAAGDVQVTISPIDVSTPELGAFPGDFGGVSAGGDPVLLETFSLMDVEITQNGNPINLAPGTTAELEFLLPAGTPLTAGQTIPLWFFDVESGNWVEEGFGTVVEVGIGQLAIVGEVSHFSWWNCDQPIDTFSCVSGTVTDVDGAPVANAQVFASGVDYNGTSYSQTDANGTYCANVRIDSTVEITATAFGGTVQSASVTVNTGVDNVTCATGGCVNADLVLPGLSCIEGIVLDSAGIPVADVNVTTSAGTAAVSGADGTFCVTAPAETEVFVLAPGFPVETATAPADGPTCGTGGCGSVTLQEGSVEPDTTCLNGQVLGYPVEVGAPVGEGFPIEGETVVAFDGDTGEPLGTPAVTDANGDYCIEGLPADTFVFIETQGPNCGFGEGLATTSTDPGTCADPASCVDAGQIFCNGEIGS